MGKKINQPTPEQQAALDNVIDNSVDEVRIPGTKSVYKIKWLRWGARRKITRIMQSKRADDEILFLHKIAACIILNGYWRIKFFFPFLWRWFAYIKQYSEGQLSPIIETGKKKVPAEDFYLTTILVIGMKDLMMTMTKREAELILREQATEQPTPAEKKDNG